MATAAAGGVSRHMLLSGNIPLESPLVPGSSGPKQTFKKKKSKTLYNGFAKMTIFDQNGTAGSGRSENHPKMRVFARQPPLGGPAVRFKPEARAGGSLRLPHGLPDV